MCGIVALALLRLYIYYCCAECVHVCVARCMLQEAQSEILRCGSVRFSGIANPAVRFDFVIYSTVRLGAVFKNRKSYGAVRYGLRKSEILPCGSVL